MIDLCIELVVYKVTNAEAALSARRELKPVIEKMDGIKSWQPLRSHSDKLVFADYVVWEDCDKAKAAAKQFETDARFAPFAKTIDKTITFDHYKIISKE